MTSARLSADWFRNNLSSLFIYLFIFYGDIKVHHGKCVVMDWCVWYQELIFFFFTFLLENLLNVVLFVFQIWSFDLCDGDSFKLNLLNSIMIIIMKKTIDLNSHTQCHWVNRSTNTDFIWYFVWEKSDLYQPVESNQIVPVICYLPSCCLQSRHCVILSQKIINLMSLWVCHRWNDLIMII